MTAAGIEPDEVTYNTMIHFCAERSQSEMARRFLEAMRNRGLGPSLKSYTSLIRAHAKCGELDEAEAALREMIKEGVSPSASTFTCLVKAAREAKGGVPRAWAIFREM